MKHYENKRPIISPQSFIAEGVRIVGDVVIGKNSSIWFNAVLRGDVAPIRVGEGTNIQDNSVVVHTSRFGDKGSSIIGNNITIGHSAVINACEIHDNAFVGNVFNYNGWCSNRELRLCSRWFSYYSR